MNIIPFRPEHLEELKLQPSQAWMQDNMTPEYGAALAAAGPAYTAIVGNGVVGCAGLIPQWQGRALAWALIACEAGPHLLGIVRAIRRGLDVIHPCRRVEAAVCADFAAGHRLMGLLGFTRETPEPMRSYTPDGADAVLYAKVRG